MLILFILQFYNIAQSQSKNKRNEMKWNERKIYNQKNKKSPLFASHTPNSWVELICIREFFRLLIFFGLLAIDHYILSYSLQLQSNRLNRTHQTNSSKAKNFFIFSAIEFNLIFKIPSESQMRSIREIC